jgi:hypothetical protein
MNDFESQRAEKAARFRELAEKHENISTGRHFAASQQLDMIPLGQPILVGHHSEKSHRRHLKRIDQHFAKAQEHHNKAEHYRRRVAALESNRVIFSDDPDATEKLVDKIERLMKRQGTMKRANQLIRKADREGLADLGFSEETIAKLFNADFAGRVGFPNYALTNNSANIRRLEKRLANLQKAQTDQTTEEEFPGRIRLVDNVEDNRLQIFFREIPSEAIRRELKSNGFRWSPTVGAWQRHRSNRATYLAKLMLTNRPMTPSILHEPIISVSQQRRKSRSYAFHARTWFRIVGTLASGKKVPLRRRAMNGYSQRCAIRLSWRRQSARILRVAAD